MELLFTYIIKPFIQILKLNFMQIRTFGKYGLHTIQYPSKRWGYVGTVPIELCNERDGLFGKEYPSKVFNTEAEAIKFANETIVDNQIISRQKQK